MDIWQLRYFLSVLEAKSVSGGAALLGVAQPAVAKQMKKLEIELGVELCPRSRIRRMLDVAAGSIGVQLTPASEVESMRVTKELVRRRLGELVLPPSIVRNRLDAGQLRAIPIAGPEMVMHAYFVYALSRRAILPLPALCSALHDFVRNSDKFSLSMTDGC